LKSALGVDAMKTKKNVTKLYIEELERPLPAPATVTTLALGEECFCGGKKATTLAIGEEAS